MYKGIYIAASGAMMGEREMDLLTRNIANSSTDGYKKERVAFRSFLLPPVEDVSQPERVMTEEAAVITDYSQGEMIATGDPFDLAIRGDGFFVLEGNLYTRKGTFILDSEGFLTDTEGRRVMGEDGNPIHIGSGSMNVSRDGEVTVNGTVVGRLKVVDFPKEYKLVKMGNGVYTSTIDTQPIKADVEVMQGMKEGSNVKVIEEMVKLISLTRQVEAYQKMIRAFDDSSGKAINEIGRL